MSEREIPGVLGEIAGIEVEEYDSLFGTKRLDRLRWKRGDSR